MGAFEPAAKTTFVPLSIQILIFDVPDESPLASKERV